MAGKKRLTKKHKKLCLRHLKRALAMLQGLINRCHTSVKCFENVQTQTGNTLF